MKTKGLHIFISALFVLSVLVIPAVGFCEEEQVIQVPTLDMYFKTFFLVQSDSDFDRSRPVYDEYGQSVGYIATLLEPGITWQPVDMVRFRYGAHIGDNLWSRNDAEEMDPQAGNMTLFQSREMWGEVSLLNHSLVLRSGYQQIADPTHLFIERYMGAFSLDYHMGNGSLSLLAGQLPDEVFETTSAEDAASDLQINNFENDAFLFGLSGSAYLHNQWNLSPAVFVLYDKSEIDRPKTLINPCVRLSTSHGGSFLFLDLAMQFGSHKRAAINNRDLDYLAGAGQFGFGHTFDHWRVELNALVLTADDGDRYNQNETGYTYSGKSLSRTLMLTENWLYDQYDNLDERAAAQRAGLSLADFTLSWLPTESVDLFATYGVGQVLDTENLEDDANLGHEAILGVTWQPIPQHIDFTLLGGALWPGASGARLVNQIDAEALDPIYYGQGAMILSF